MVVLEGVYGEQYDPDFAGPGFLTGELLDLKLALSSSSSRRSPGSPSEELGVLGWLAELFTLGLANPLGFESHHLVAYTLLSLAEPGEREVLVDLDFEEDGFADVSAYLRGRDADFIGAGDFDLDALLSP